VLYNNWKPSLGESGRLLFFDHVYFFSPETYDDNNIRGEMTTYAADMLCRVTVAVLLTAIIVFKDFTRPGCTGNDIPPTRWAYGP